MGWFAPSTISVTKLWSKEQWMPRIIHLLLYAQPYCSSDGAVQSPVLPLPERELSWR